MIDLKLSENEAYNLTDEQKEIAQARKLELVLLPYLRRNLDFFYAGGDLKGKANSYRNIMDKDKLEADINTKKVNSTVCKPLCEMVVEILNENGINAETVSCDTDMFKHVDVLITTKFGKKYIINYLEDIENIQTGLRTPNFASVEYYNRRYKKFENTTTTDGKSLEGIDFLNKEELEKIDRNLGYTKNNMYMNDVISQIKREFLKFKDIMIENEWMQTEISKNESNPQNNDRYKEICNKYQNMNEDELLENKLDFLFQHFNDRMQLNGHTDLVMYNRMLLKELLTDIEYNKLSRYDCFTYKENIPQDSNVNGILDLENEENKDKLRFILLKIKDKGYAFSTKSKAYVKLSQQEIEIISEYTIMSKAEKPSDLLLKLCDRGNALPLVFHPIGSELLNERAKIIENSDLTQEEKKVEVQKLADSIITTDEPITSITIPYSNGINKKIYIDENDEIIIETKNKKTKYHYNKKNDEFTTEEMEDKSER